MCPVGAAHDPAIANAKAKLEQYEKQLLLKKDRSEAAADPAWVYLPTSGNGPISQPENFADELHHDLSTTMKAWLVAWSGKAKIYVNGGNAVTLDSHPSLAGSVA